MGGGVEGEAVDDEAVSGLGVMEIGGGWVAAVGGGCVE